VAEAPAAPETDSAAAPPMSPPGVPPARARPAGSAVGAWAPAGRSRAATVPRGSPATHPPPTQPMPERAGLAAAAVAPTVPRAPLLRHPRACPYDRRCGARRRRAGRPPSRPSNRRAMPRPPQPSPTRAPSLLRRWRGARTQPTQKTPWPNPIWRIYRSDSEYDTARMRNAGPPTRWTPTRPKCATRPSHQLVAQCRTDARTSDCNRRVSVATRLRRD
jgi:hypothetical protein